MIATFFLVAAQGLSFTADRIAADNVTKALVATGHVVAVQTPYSLRGECVSKSADGTYRFMDPTCATTCTNDVGHTHWGVSGEVEYKDNDYVLLKNAWVKFYEIPIFWIPYLYYPLDTDCGFSWMPGYVGSWGAYLLTKYTYHIIGDRARQDNTWWLRGDTRFDLRYRQGIAMGEDLWWNLGDFGSGQFNFYYAWDQDVASRYGSAGSNQYTANWGSNVDEQRYLISGKHKWQATERDVVRLRGSYYSDSYMRNDFMRKTMFNLKSQWLTYENSGVFWEHLEDAFSFGVETSGRLNEFYAMTGRLPELYFDVNPLPVFSSPINYESQSRFGYLTRDYAEYGSGVRSALGTNPGLWAQYKSFRLDTYHRLTAPFKTFDDVLSVVPRLGYHGTYWSESGKNDIEGLSVAQDAGAAFRSIGEAGATFSSRGVAELDGGWLHMIEPYFDALGQQAWYNGCGDDNRPYVFDSIDASRGWEDQFAGRSRNLPYSYYGLTPGLRNVWSSIDETGRVRPIVDLDAYLAAQFNTASHTLGNDSHKLAKVGSPNYGASNGAYVPGARLKWMPVDGTTLGTRAEYDIENNRFAYASLLWKQTVTKDFNYSFQYNLRDHRFWDFSSPPQYRVQNRVIDEQGYCKMQIIDCRFEHKLFEWLAWSPHLRWDASANELDAVGCWIDYLTDCLGFRVILEYDNEISTIDGYWRDEEWSIGFYIYLRAFGADSGNLFYN